MPINDYFNVATPEKAKSQKSSTSGIDSYFNTSATPAAATETKTPKQAQVEAAAPKKSSVIDTIAKYSPLNYFENKADQYEVKTAAPRQAGETQQQYHDRMVAYAPQAQAEAARVNKLNSAGNLFGVDYKTFTESLPFGIGTAIKAIRQDPASAAAITGADVKSSIAPVLIDTAKGFVKAPINGALNVLGLAGNKQLSFDIPYLGQVSNANFKAAQRVANGENAASVALEEGSNAILDTLFFFDLVSRPFAPRTETVGKLDAEQSAKMGKPNTLGNGTPEAAAPRTGRLYEKPTITTPKYTELNPQVLERMKTEGVDLSKYDPSRPTYFKFQLETNGNITGQVIQVKPSFFDAIRSKLTGNGTEIANVPKAGSGAASEAGAAAEAPKSAAPVASEAPKAPQAAETGAGGTKAAPAAESSSGASSAVITAELAKLPPEATEVIAEKVVPSAALKDVKPVVTEKAGISPFAENPTLNLPSAKVQARINALERSYATTQDPKLADEIGQLQSALAQFQEATKNTKIAIQLNGRRIASVDTFEYSNGKFSPRVDAATPNFGITTSFRADNAFPSEDAAIAAGKKELIGWAKEQLARAEGTDKTILENIIKHAENPKAKSKEIVQPVVGELEKQVSETYKGNPKAEEVLSNIFTSLDISQAGFRVSVNGETKGVSSTFPKWIPEELRSKDLFEKLYSRLDLNNLKVPEGNKTAQRALYNILLDEVDAQLGVDTSAARKEITQIYESKKDNAGEAKGGNDRSPAGDKGGEVKQEKPAEKPVAEPKKAAKKPLAKPNIQVKSDVLSPEELAKKADALPAYKSGSKNAAIGVFQDGTPVIEGNLDKVKPIEMPELVRLARQLSGEIPAVKKKVGRKFGGQVRGVFKPGTGKIELNADIFSDPEGAAKTLAHEIGHLVDWLPDKMLARGNLLGRLLSLRKFTKSVFGMEEGMLGKQPLDLKQLRNDAFQSILKENGVKFGTYITNAEVRAKLKDKIKARYTELVDAKHGVRNEKVKKELQAVTEYWRPYDKANSGDSYVAYRNSSEELYADAISVLFNSPGTLQKMAPTFYKEFFANLDAKPEVKAAFFELQELLNGSTEQIFKARKEDIRKGFSRAEDIQAEFAEKKKLRVSAFWERLRQQLDDINHPILKKQAAAEANGAVLADEDNPKFILQEQSMADNENFLMVENIDKNIVKPIEAAGMTIDDFGEYLLLDRIQKDRADIANPFGFNPKNAAEQVAHLKTQLGDKNFALLQEKVQAFHDLVFQSVEEAVKVGSYNRETFETRIKPNKDSYASFQVVDYMQDHVPATIKGQVGTLKEVANPFVSTILKTIALNRLNAYQRAKNSTVKMLKEFYPEDIAPTKRITSDGKLTVFKPARDRGAIELLEDGKMQSYDVDPYIAESFLKSKAGDLNAIVALMDKFNSKLFKPVVTTYNLGFAAAFNPIRDFKRNYKLIPNATVKNLLTAWVKSVPQAVKFAKGELDDFTRSLVESKAINAPVNDFNFDPREDELGRILERYGLIKEKYEPWNSKAAEVVRKTLFKPVAQVLEGIRFVADSLEVVSKIAGAKIRIQGGEGGKQLAYNLRNYTGTPNYKVRGKQTGTTNAIFVFSNIAKEGLKSDFRIASDPKTRSGYWWKTVKIDLLPKFLQFLAAGGFLGVALKKFFDKVSEYDKSNYQIIPLGYYDAGTGKFSLPTDGGEGKKAVYMRIPTDNELGRLTSVAFWKMANFVGNGSAQELQDIFAVGAGQLPSVTPIVTIAAGWMSYLSGKNPYDAFHGRGVIDDTTWAAGGGAALKKMVEWTLNTAGFTKFATFDTSKQTGLETALQVAPWFSSVVKITNYGEQEQLKRIAGDQKQKEAKQTLEDRDLIAKYVTKARADKSTIFAATKYRKDLITEALGGHTPKTKEENDYADKLMQKFTRALKRGLNDDPRVDAIISSTSNEQKRAILRTIQKDMTTEEFAKFRTGLLQDKIATPALFYGLSTVK